VTLLPPRMRVTLLLYYTVLVTLIAGRCSGGSGERAEEGHVRHERWSRRTPPDTPEYIEVGVEKGVPVSLNGKTLSPATILEQANEIGGRNGVGRIDMVENRLVGMKSRGVYETPGGTILFQAVRELEALVLDRETMQVSSTVQYGSLTTRHQRCTTGSFVLFGKR